MADKEVDPPAEEPQSAWTRLAADYEQARDREDSLDRLLDWPAELAVIGDVTGQTILDIGRGSGAKDTELLARGAAGRTRPPRVQGAEGSRRGSESVGAGA